MMSEKKFKVGDRVRITSFCVKYEIEPIYGTVVSIEDYGIGVELDTPEILYLDARNIELAPPSDPRAAFLQELKELLTKYNAEIQADKGCFDVSIDGKYALTIEGNDDYSITADNIMNYQQ